MYYKDEHMKLSDCKKFKIVDHVLYLLKLFIGAQLKKE